jgi:hypothetical protein
MNYTVHIAILYLSEVFCALITKNCLKKEQKQIVIIK